MMVSEESMDQDQDTDQKVITLLLYGDAKVGKTTIVNKFLGHDMNLLDDSVENHSGSVLESNK